MMPGRNRQARRCLVAIVFLVLAALLAVSCASPAAAPTAAPAPTKAAAPAAPAPTAAPAAAAPTQAPAAKPAAAPATEKPVVWEFSSALPATHFTQVPIKEFADEVEKASGGRLQIKLHWSSTLLKSSETLAALKENTIQAGWTGTTDYEDILPAFKVMQMPLAILPDKALEKPEDVRTFWQQYLKLMWTDSVRQYLGQRLEALGVKVLWESSMPPVFAFTKQPIAGPKDWTGLKLRSYSPTGASVIQALGASAVVVSTSEVSTALERGVVQGVITAHSSMGSLKWYEFTNVANHWPMQGGLPVYTLVSKTAWDKLPADLQAVVEKVVKDQKPAERTFDLGWQQEDAAFTALQGQYKGRIVPISMADMKEAREKAVPVFQQAVKSAGAEGQNAVKAIWGSVWDKDFMQRVAGQ